MEVGGEFMLKRPNGLCAIRSGPATRHRPPIHCKLIAPSGATISRDG